MSWNPFKKAFSGRRTRSEDVEFEKEISKLKQVRAVTKRMYKDMQKCNETETVYVRCRQHLVNDVRLAPVARSEPLRLMAEVLGSLIQLHHNHSRELRASQDTVFVDPIKRLSSVYKHVELQAKQRELKLLDLERQQVKLEKYGRKNTSSLQFQQLQQTGTQSKLESSQRTVTTARADYERVHDRLMLEIPQLIDQRKNYFGACLQAVVNSKNLYYKESSSNSLSCLRSLCGSSGIKSEEEIQRTTTTHLSTIKSLSIVGSQ